MSIFNYQLESTNKLFISDPALNETQTNILAYDTNTKEVQYRTSFPNPFNQDLDNNDQVVFRSLKLGTVNTTVDNECLHIQSNGDACIYLQADRDTSGFSDFPFFWLNINGGAQSSAISMSPFISQFPE